MFGKLFNKKANQMKAELKKVENRDLMEAIIGGSILVAGADGELSENELKTLEMSIQANPALAHFGPEITATINKFKQQLDVGFRMAKLKIMREITDVSSNPQEAEEVFINCLLIAESDGEIDAAEMAILKDIANALGQRLSDYGVE